jgi:hypothetical protein
MIDGMGWGELSPVSTDVHLEGGENGDEDG